MQVSVDQIKKTAHLAKLSIPENQMDDVLKKFNSVLELNAKLAAVDTKNIEPLSHPLEQNQPFREDVVTEKDQRDLFLRLSPAAAHPATKEGLFIVPTVIETE